MENRFNPYEWDAKTYDNPKDIYSALDKFGIYGKKIKSIAVIGHADAVGEHEVYKALQKCGIRQSQMKHYKDDVLVPCSVTISEPVIFTFEDNSTFEFQLMYGTRIKMSVNRLSSEILNGVNNSNIDLANLFTKLKGCRIEKLYISQDTKEVYWGDADSFERDYSTISFILRCDDEPAVEFKGSYGNIGCELSLKNAYGQFDETITFKEYNEYFKDEYNAEILCGHNTSSYFWIRPVKSYTTEPYDCRCEYEECEMAIEESNVEAFLYYFLDKYYDASLPFHKKREYGERFEWYLEDNLFTYPALRKMLDEIKKTSHLLACDYDNPALDMVKKHISIFDLGYTIKSSLESDNDEYEMFYEIDVDKDTYKKEHIGVAIDFYNRFCWLLELMMEHNPGNEYISFMGP